jgi:hypothetical protein
MKQEAFLSLLVNLILEYAKSGVPVNKNVLKLCGTQQILFYANDVNM